MEQHFLLQNWTFHLGDKPDAWQRGYHDPTWEQVVVPHDWSAGFPFSTANSSGTGYLPGGTGWYRTHFSLSTMPANGRALLTFDGIYKNSQVWCNGYYLGKRPSGYATFTYDISDFVEQAAENVIAVRVSHEDIADSRWYTGSGIYRKVTVTLLPSVHIRTNEVVFHADIADSGAATVSIHTPVHNTSRAPAQARISASLEDRDGAIFHLPAQALLLPPESSSALRLEGVLPQPRLWSTTSPHLYQLRIQVESGGQRQTFLQKVGIRSFRFDGETGFFLNGEAMKIKGVCLHHDGGCLGAAVWPAVWQRRLEKLKAMGCNAIRMAHNPHMPELYDLCDAMGFLVMDEAFDEWEGAKNKWHQGHNVYPPKHQGYFEDFHAWHEADLSAMVLQGRNRPSIVMWSIGNELDYPNDPYGHPLFAQMEGNNDANKPKEEMEYSPNKPNMQRLATLARRLASIVKKHDATRPVLVASAFPELSSQLGFFDSLDMVGYNYKESFYHAHHAQRPHLPLIGSENGHSLQAWHAVTENPFISGQFLWTGIDYLGESRGEWPTHGSPAGLLTTAGFEKAEYYRRQALWLDQPVLWLGTVGPDGTPLPQWTGTKGKAVRVVCYTNLTNVSLQLQGTTCQEAPLHSSAEGLCWDIPYAEGTLAASGTDRKGKRHTCILTTPAKERELTLKPWTPSQPLQPQQGAYTLHQIEIALTDPQGIPCPYRQSRIQVDLQGEGLFLGLDNGNLADPTPLRSTTKELYHGRGLLYLLTRGPKGQATLSIHWEGKPYIIRL